MRKFAQLKCSPGNKPCGGRCIPHGLHCHEDEAEGTGKRQKSNERLSSGQKKVIAAGTLATAALLTTGAILLSKRGKNEGTESDYSRATDLEQHRATLPQSVQNPQPTIVRGKDPVPVDVVPGVLKRKLQGEIPPEPDYNAKFDTQSAAIDNHVRQQIIHNRYIARIQAAEALELGNKAYFIDLEMTGVSSSDATHGFTPLGHGEPVSIGLVSGGSGEREISLKIPLRPGRRISAVDTEIHGIRDEDVAEARTFADIYPTLKDEFTGRHIFTYGPTDITWIDDACRRDNLPLIDFANVVRKSDGTIDWEHDATTADVRKVFGDYLGPQVNADFISYVGRELIKRENKDLSYKDKVRKYAKPQGQVGYYIQLPAYPIAGVDADSHDPVVDSYRTKKLMLEIAKGTAVRP